MYEISWYQWLSVLVVFIIGGWIGYLEGYGKGKKANESPSKLLKVTFANGNEYFISCDTAPEHTIEGTDLSLNWPQNSGEITVTEDHGGYEESLTFHTNLLPQVIIYTNVTQFSSLNRTKSA